MSFVFLFAAAEGVLRLRQRGRHGFTNIDDLIETDPNDPLVRRLIPGAVVGPMSINSHGFRGPEVATPKPAGTVRLAFLGASTTFCAEVSANDKVWPAQVAHTLGATRAVDYVNAAVPGTRLEQTQRLLDEKLAALEPDVIVFYEATNELSFDTRNLARERGLYRDVSGFSDWLAHHSVFFELAQKNLQVMTRASAAQVSADKLTFEPRELSREFEQRLRKLVASAQARAKVVALVTFASRVRRGLSPDEMEAALVTASYYMPYMSSDGLIAGFEEYNRVIRQVAAETGSILIEAENLVPATPEYYTDSVHFTDTGAELMGKIVARGLAASPKFQALFDSETRP